MNRRHARHAELRSDQRGLILVVAIPMAAILVGCLWYLASLGDAVVYRERLQDAADATALEGAVLHARGMNASAMLNIVSSLLLATEAAAHSGEALTSTGFAPSAEPAASDPQLSARVAQTVAIARQLQAGVAAAAPVLASVVASRDNTRFYSAQRAADETLAFSYALLPDAADEAVEVDPARRWLLRPRGSTAAAPRLATSLMASDRYASMPSLPIAVDDGYAVTRAARERAKGGAHAAEAQALQATPAYEVWREAENGNVMLQVWAAARAREPEREKRAERALGLVAATSESVPTYAQAEYYFACPAAAPTWDECGEHALWTLGWSARMRRFWWPAGALAASPVTRTRLQHAFASADRVLADGLRQLGVGGLGTARPDARGQLSPSALWASLAGDSRSWIH